MSNTTSLEKLRQKVAAAQAALEMAQAKLAAAEAKETGAKPPVTGLDLLWQAALPMARTRSSKVRCRTEWNRIPPEERPTVREALDALRAWNRCKEWRKDCNEFVPGLHRWIKDRQWENVPEEVKPEAPSRYRAPTPKPLPTPKPEEVILPHEVREIFRSLKMTESTKQNTDDDEYEYE